MGSRAHVELKSERSGVFLGFLSSRNSLFVSHRGPCCIPDSWKMEASAKMSASRSVCCSAVSVLTNTMLWYLAAAWPLPQRPGRLELTQVKILIMHVETAAAQAVPEAQRLWSQCSLCPCHVQDMLLCTPTQLECLFAVLMWPSRESPSCGFASVLDLSWALGLSRAKLGMSRPFLGREREGWEGSVEKYLVEKALRPPS